MFAGQAAITGVSVSLTVTVKVHALVFPTASVAVQVTGVTPLLKLEPLAGSQAIVEPGQLSVTEAENVTLLAQLPGAVLTTILAGQIACGASVSLTVTLNVQAFVFPLVSVAVHVTVVIPVPKALPLAGTQADVTPGQLSAAVAVKMTLLAQLPPAVVTTMSDGQEMVGFSVSLTVTVKVQAL